MNGFIRHEKPYTYTILFPCDDSFPIRREKRNSTKTKLTGLAKANELSNIEARLPGWEVTTKTADSRSLLLGPIDNPTSSKIRHVASIERTLGYNSQASNSITTIKILIVITPLKSAE